MAEGTGRRAVKLWQVAAIAILVVGSLAISVGSWAWFQRNKANNRTAARANAAQIAVTTKKTLDGYGNEIATAVALFTPPVLIDRTEFHTYVKHLGLYSRYRGIFGLGLISLVSAADLPQFVSGWRSDGDPTYSVAPPGARSTYCLVSQFDEKNLKTPVNLLGYDMCTFKTLVPVLDEATTSGQVQAIAESVLVPGPAYRGNFLLVSPVYNGEPTTAAERQAQHVGWVAALVDGAQMLKAALGPAGDHLGVELFSGSSVAPKVLVVSSPRGVELRAAGSVTEHFTGGGVWTLRIRPLPGAPGPANPLEGPGLVFVMAILLNLGLAALVWDLGRGRLRARVSFTESERRFHSMASSSPVGILELTQDGTALYFNKSVNEIAGVDDSFWQGHKWSDCVYPEDRGSMAASALSAWDNKEDLAASFRVQRPSGEVRNVRVLAAPVSGGTGATSSFVVTIQDITEEVAATEALAYQAMHDSLTGLPNRALFLDRLSMELGHASRSGSDLAVMFLDLDGFKVVNDGMGHQAGDELLQAVGARFRGVVRAGETVARLGGDEFTFIFHDVRGPDKATEIATRILGTLSEPIVIHGRTMVVTGSIGIVLPRPGANAAQVLRDADVGMYRAKESGRARFELFAEQPSPV